MVTTTETAPELRGGVSRPLLRALVWVGRLLLVATAVGLAWRYEAWSAILVLVAGWLLLDPIIPRRTRVALAFVAAPIVGVASCSLLVPSFLGYQLARGTIYECVSELPTYRGVRIAFDLTAAGGDRSRVLPGLACSHFRGPYHLGISLHEGRFAATRARLLTGLASTPDGSMRVPLDLRHATYMYDEERSGVQADGWMRFQHEWTDSGGSARPLESAYIRAIPVGSPVDLDPLGPEIIVTLTLELDVDGKVSSHPVRLVLRRQTVTASGITISSP